jgi:hypothetical protein
MPAFTSGGLKRRTAPGCPVAAHANVVFEVRTLWRSHILGGGGILADFANNEFDNKIICPSIQLELYGPASG